MMPAAGENELAMQVAVGSPGARDLTSSVLRVGVANIEAHEQWPLLSKLPVNLTVSVPLANFKVKDLLALSNGEIVNSAWPKEEDVPVRIGSALVSWSEFEVVNQRMAIRLTRLA